MDLSPTANGELNHHPSREASIYTAKSVAEIQATLAHLSRQEASVTARLDALIASQADLSRELGRLDLLRAHLGTQVVNTRAISNGMLSDAASTAKRISGAVKRLDHEQHNVKATLEVVEQVAELKACVLGVNGSMGAPQDWETAASYLSRASKIPDEVIDGTFAEQIVPTAEVPDPPRVTLNSAAESLCGLFLREFDKAAGEGDGAKITRFFKLFPLIGRSEAGLDAYGRYVCHGVTSRARANFNAVTGRKDGYFYANVLTKLFEYIAHIVENHEPLVDRHYGVGRMVRVIERLQNEADVQGGIILDTWHDDRRVDRKLTDIKSYAFSFLVQSFLPAQRPAGGTPRSGSPAKRDQYAGRNSEDEGVDMKEVDGMLGEIAVMLGRWSLYSRFLASKSKVCLLHSSSKRSLNNLQPSAEDGDVDQSTLVMPEYLLSSNLYKKVHKGLIEPFDIMTTFFFRRSVEKAFQLDEPPSDLTLNPKKPLGSDPPFITSAVGDVMYIVKEVLQRSLATSQRTVVASVVPTIGRVLGSDFIGMIQRKMRDESYPSAAVKGSLPPENKIISFLILINNLDIANDYVKRIVQSHIGSPSPVEDGSNGTTHASSTLQDLFPFGHDATFVQNHLQSMSIGFSDKATELISEAITVIFSNVVRPRIRPILAEAFRDIDYTHSGKVDDGFEDDGDADQDPNLQDDVVKLRFERSWSALTRPLKRITTDGNSDRLLTVSLTHLAEALEKRLWSYYGRVTSLGAIRLERDVAGIVAAAVQGNKYALREVFTRVTQLCLVMNMEEDEWEGIRDGVDETEWGWKISAEERARARAIVSSTGREAL